MKTKFKKYVGEGFLIVFSVLFALFINKPLIQFQLRFWELTGQEELMADFYKEAIEQMKE